jgi:uncharacterized protein
MLETIIFVLIVLFISATIRSTFGFGDALIAMPLLTMVIGIKVAAPVVAIFSFIYAVIILVKDWRKIKVSGFKRIIFFVILGIPVGLFYLKDVNENLVKIVLAIILISFSIFQLINPHLLLLKSDKSAFIFGFISGILGGAYNTNGPPIIIYGSLRSWEPERFRAIMQGFFFPTNLFIIIGHGIAGFWTNQVFNWSCLGLPVVIIGIVLGHKLNKLFPAEKFTKWVYIMLIIIGFILFMRVLWN